MCPWFVPWKKGEDDGAREGGWAGDETAHAGLKASEVGKHCESDRPSGIPNPSSIKTLSKHHMRRMRLCVFCRVCGTGTLLTTVLLSLPFQMSPGTRDSLTN